MRLLFIDACARKESKTRKAAERLINNIGGETEILELYKTDIKPVNEELLSKRTELISQKAFGDELFFYARRFAAADIIIIAAPYWDMSFPAILKVYIENIMISGLVFRYDENGIPQGLCNAKKLFYVSTAGGPAPVNHGYEYIKRLCRDMLSIDETRLFQAENMDIPDTDVNSVIEKLNNEIDLYTCINFERNDNE